MAGGAKHGAQNKLYYNSGTRASPTWVLIAQVGDVSAPDLNRDTAEVPIRSVSWNMFLPGNLNASIEFDLLYNRGNTVFDALRTAFFAGTVYEFAMLDDAVATTGAAGLKMFSIIKNFPISQPIKDRTSVAVRLDPAYHEESSAITEPVWHTTS